MKKIKVCVKCWKNGSGWSHTSEIDTIEKDTQEVCEACDEYAKDYFQDQTLPEEEDYVIIFEEDGNEICRSNWATELQNKEFMK